MPATPVTRSGVPPSAMAGAAGPGFRTKTGGQGPGARVQSLELDLQELACKLADNVNLNCDPLRDAFNLLVQQRCMAVADDHFHAGPTMIYGNEKGRESSIFVKDGREEFRVTELGRRIVKMYAPRQSGQAAATEPNRPHL